ncbi:MAG: iron ABC transporter permease [Propionibacteriales bacterium]|nr:iron ABC transporter permease [Propionibacteriales bacterium]
MVAVAVAVLALIPLLFVVVYTVAIGPEQAWRLLVRPRVGELLFNTARLVVSGVVFSIVIGTGSAWLVERTDVAFRRLWHLLLTAPLAVPAFVNGFGWVSLTHRVEGFAGAVMVVTLSYYPLVYLPVAATLRGLDPALEETAYSMGYSRWRTFVRVVLPQLRPAVLGGSLLVGLHLLAEFGALQMLRFPTFTTAIYDQYRSSFNGPAANMIASVLVLSCLVLLLTELRLRGQHRYARTGRGTARVATRQQLHALTGPVLLGLAALATLALGVPTASLIHWLIVGSSTEFPVGELASAAATSIGLGAAAALATTLLALPVAWLVVRHRGHASTAVERSTYFANALPGIVVALALVTVSIRVVPVVYQTFTLLILAYAVMFLPRAVVSVRVALEQAPPRLDEVSRSLGVGPLTTARRVTLPLILPGLGAGAALVFLAVVTELTATLLLAPIDTSTLATEFWSRSSSVAYGAAAPYALLMVLVSMPATYLLSRHPRRSMTL